MKPLVIGAVYAYRGIGTKGRQVPRLTTYGSQVLGKWVGEPDYTKGG